MKRILFSIAIFTALVSCSKEQEAITIDSECVLAQADDFKFDEPQTRISISQEGKSAPTFAWKAGDVIGVIPMDGKTVQSNYEISSIGDDPKTATFDGGVWALKEGKGYAAYYPFKREIAVSGDKLEFSFTGQTQSANNSLAHIGDYDYMYASTVTASSSAASFQFKHLVSLVRVQITVPETDQYTNLTLESTSSWFASKASLNLSDGTMTATQSTKSCSIALDDISVSSGEVLTVWFSMLPTSALNGGSVKVKLYGKDSYSEIDISNLKSFEAGKAYSFSCSAGSQEESGLVDLGLSVKWATCNLGANNPEEYGDHYAWGETETKTKYTEDTYKFYNSETVSEGGFDIEYKGYTKYIPQSTADQYGFKGFYDDKTALDPEDDVAHVKLGGKWRMPTRAEFNELINNCQCDWVTYKGVKGRKFTSKKEGYTDKWIFLPAAGYRYDNLYYAGSNGFYRSSSLYTSGPSNACYMSFYSGFVSTNDLNEKRYYGLSVRPVSE